MRLNPDLPPKLEEIINKALEKDRDLRYQHAADMRADLQRLKRDFESNKTVATTEEETKKRPRLWWGIVAVAVIMLGGGLFSRPACHAAGFC